MHGSFESKTKIVDDFIAKYEEHSRKSVEKKVKAIFVKEKRNDDPRLRYYVTEAMLTELNLEGD